MIPSGPLHPRRLDPMNHMDLSSVAAILGKGEEMEQKNALPL